MKLLKLYLTKWNLLISIRFMVNSILNIVDNLTEGIHKIKCKNCGCFPEYIRVKGAINVIQKSLMKN